MDTQLELFPLSAVVTGRPHTRPIAVADAADTDTHPTQVEELPFDVDDDQEAAA